MFDGAACQQFAGHQHLFRQGDAGMLDHLDQLVGCRPAQHGGVLLVGHQLGLDHPREVDAIVAHHRDIVRDAQPRLRNGVVAAQRGEIIGEEDAGGPLRK